MTVEQRVSEPATQEEEQGAGWDQAVSEIASLPPEVAANVGQAIEVLDDPEAAIAKVRRKAAANLELGKTSESQFLTELAEIMEKELALPEPPQENKYASKDESLRNAAAVIIGFTAVAIESVIDVFDYPELSQIIIAFVIVALLSKAMLASEKSTSFAHGQQYAEAQADFENMEAQVQQRLKEIQQQLQDAAAQEGSSRIETSQEGV